MNRWRLAALLVASSCATWTATGRLVDGKCLHVGARPSSDGRGDYALTLQVSSDWPLPCAAAP
jgi:hypothetical protein